MDVMTMAYTVGFLGLRIRYWIIILIVILVVLGLAYFVRNRGV